MSVMRFYRARKAWRKVYHEAPRDCAAFERSGCKSAVLLVGVDGRPYDRRRLRDLGWRPCKRCQGLR